MGMSEPWSPSEPWFSGEWDNAAGEWDNGAGDWDNAAGEREAQHVIA